MRVGAITYIFNSEAKVYIKRQFEYKSGSISWDLHIYYKQRKGSIIVKLA